MTNHAWPTAPIIQAVCRAENGDLRDAGIWQRQPEGAYLLIYNGFTVEQNKGDYFTNITEYWPTNPYQKETNK